MAVLALRFALAPLVILIVTLVQRRFGHGSGGRIIGLPLTTGPFLVLVALTDGAEAASVAAAGVVAGQVSVILFCTAYAHLARWARWYAALVLALAVALSGVLVVRGVHTAWLALLVVYGVIGVALATWPRDVDDRVAPVGARRWDLPVRMATAALVVGTVTALARVLGPFVAGLLSTAPVILSMMAPLTHRGHGVDATSAFLRGTVWSMPGTILFAAVVAMTVVPLGALAFVLGLVALVLLDRALSAVRVSVPALSR